MQPHFLHIKAGADQATALVESWFGNDKPNYEASIELEDNGWVTLALDLDFQPTEEWLVLGAQVDLLYESYSTSLLMGEIVFVSGGKLVRHLLLDAENPDENQDHGVLRGENSRRFQSWGDIWGFVEDCKWRREVEP